MAKFRVWARSISDVYLDVEAETEEEARDIAENTDGGLFTDAGTGDWEYGTTERREE